MSNEIIREKSKAGRPTKLTDELLKQLAYLWQLSDEHIMSDAEIAESLSIKAKTLDSWITRNTKNIAGIRVLS